MKIKKEPSSSSERKAAVSQTDARPKNKTQQQQQKESCRFKLQKSARCPIRLPRIWRPRQANRSIDVVCAVPSSGQDGREPGGIEEEEVSVPSSGQYGREPDGEEGDGENDQKTRAEPVKRADQKQLNRRREEEIFSIRLFSLCLVRWP